VVLLGVEDAGLHAAIRSLSGGLIQLLRGG